jgi:hypothetical protein
MMQVPSTNQSHRSRRSAARSTAAIAEWFDGFLCCSAGYTGSDAIDDNSIAYSENDNHTFYSSVLSSKTLCSDASVVYDQDQESMQWSSFSETNRSPRKHQKSRHDSTGRSYRMDHLPMSPSSDATATTVLTGSTSSSRTTSPLGNCSKDNQQRHHRHKQNACQPTKPVVATSKHTRSHSTGNIVTPEEEWQQQQTQLEEARIRIKPTCTCTPSRKIPANEVVVPDNWTHEYGLRRIWSETLPKLPFATVKPTYRH